MSSTATSTTGAGSSHYLAVREDWLARTVEPILEPDLPIVDPHHHLWDRGGWRYLLDELLADLNAGHRITDTVFVQCRAFHRAHGPEELRPVGETEFVNGVAAMSAYRRLRPGADLRRHRQPRRPGARGEGGMRCWRRISWPAAGGSAASATSPPGTPIRRCSTPATRPRRG